MSRAKMDDVDLDALASEEAVESLLRGKRCFWCAAYGLWKKPDILAICFGEKQSCQLAKCFSRTPDNYRLSAQKHYGREDNIE